MSELELAGLLEDGHHYQINHGLWGDFQPMQAQKGGSGPPEEPNSHQEVCG